MRVVILSLLYVFCIGSVAKSQNLAQYEKQIFIAGKDTIRYRILYPANFDQSKKYPILFFLHGRGESGTDNEKQLSHGAKQFLSADFRKNHPAIVVFPQCSSDSYWANVDIQTINGKRTFHFRKGGKPTEAMKAATKLVDAITSENFIDQKRIYIGGLSMGGMGTYEMLRRKPKLFAAAFAICGGDHVANVKRYKKVPLWIFHGEKDDVVPPSHSMTVVNQLKILGYAPKLTLYPEANHNSWDSAFAEPQLLPWLFSNAK